MLISESKLIEAIVRGVIEHIKQYIQEGGNINIPLNGGDQSALHYAVMDRDDDMEALKVLLSVKGVNLEVRNRYGYTPFLYAAKCGNSRACKLLLKAGADYAVTTCEGKDAIELFRPNAVQSGIESFKECINKYERIRQTATSDTDDNSLRRRNLPVNRALSTEAERENITTPNHHVGFWLGFKQTFFFSGAATKSPDSESRVPLLKKVT